LCASGKYSNETGEIEETTCTDCPATTYSGDGSGLLTNCTCNEGYTGADGIVCVECQAGTFKASPGSAPCVDCARGKYAAAAALTAECSQVCQANSTSPAGSTVVQDCLCNAGYTGPSTSCTPCVAGTYKVVNGTQECTACPAGTYSIDMAASSFTSCAACPFHMFSSSGSNALTLCICNHGYTGADGHPHGCAECVAGTFKDANGSDACALCATGKYSTDTAQVDESTCQLCPAGSYSRARGARDEQACNCNAGFTGQDGAACQPCVHGTYKASNGSRLCTSCSAGKYSPDTTQISEGTCRDCPSSSSSSSMGNHQLTSCLCLKGYFGPDGGTCTQCVAGTYKIASGDAACTSCLAGQYSTAVGATSNVCQECPSNSNAAEASDEEVDCTCNAGSSGPDGDIYIYIYVYMCIYIYIYIHI